MFNYGGYTELLTAWTEGEIFLNSRITQLKLGVNVEWIHAAVEICEIIIG